MLSLMLNAAAAPATPAEGPSQLLVLGMHHSGTSIVSNLTMMMGAYGGARDELLLHPENPLKFWERRDVVALDEARLDAGLRIQKVAGDGNCMFRALVLALGSALPPPPRAAVSRGQSGTSPPRRHAYALWGCSCHRGVVRVFQPLGRSAFGMRYQRGPSSSLAIPQSRNGP